MPPKRRGAAEDAGAAAPAPKRRSTRISKTTAEKAVEDKPDPKRGATVEAKVNQHKSASSKAKSSTLGTQSQATSSASKHQSKNSPAVFEVTSLTLTHAGLKNPIECQRYVSSTSLKETLIFTHGAGGTLSASAVVNFCNGFRQVGDVLAFQGSMNLGARVKGFNACIEHLQEVQKSESKAKKERLVLGGRSMGARAAVLAATEYLSDSSKEKRDLLLVLVSYPLKGPKSDIRDSIIMALPKEVKVLFVIGDKDSMCPLDLLGEVRKQLQAESSLIVVKGADHGMHVKPARAEKRLGEVAGKMAADWVGAKEQGSKESEVQWSGEEDDVFVSSPA